MIVVMVVDVMFLVESCDGIVCSCDGCDVITLFESDNKKLDVVSVLSSKLAPNSSLSSNFKYLHNHFLLFSASG